MRQVNDDARSYVENSSARFDMIVFSLLDSHTTSSYYTNIRIDNYVYTEEALQAAKRLLKPDGVFIVKFQVDTPFIAGSTVETSPSTHTTNAERRAQGVFSVCGHENFALKEKLYQFCHFDRSIRQGPST